MTYLPANLKVLVAIYCDPDALNIYIYAYNDDLTFIIAEQWEQT